jgi:hypothetical protein
MSAGADTASGLKGPLGRPVLEPDSGTGDNIVSGGMTTAQRLVAVKLLRLRACSRERRCNNCRRFASKNE